MWKQIWEGWKRLARRVGDFQARVLLTVFYFLLVLPFGLAMRLFADPLRVKRQPTAWLERPDDPSDWQWAHRQW